MTTAVLINGIPSEYLAGFIADAESDVLYDHTGDHPSTLQDVVQVGGRLINPASVPGQPEPGTAVRYDKKDLRGVIGNLASNAGRYNIIRAHSDFSSDKTTTDPNKLLNVLENYFDGTREEVAAEIANFYLESKTRKILTSDQFLFCAKYLSDEDKATAKWREVLDGALSNALGFKGYAYASDEVIDTLSQELNAELSRLHDKERREFAEAILKELEPNGYIQNDPLSIKAKILDQLDGRGLSVDKRGQLALTLALLDPRDSKAGELLEETFKGNPIKVAEKILEGVAKYHYGTKKCAQIVANSGLSQSVAEAMIGQIITSIQQATSPGSPISSANIQLLESETHGHALRKSRQELIHDFVFELTRNSGELQEGTRIVPPYILDPVKAAFPKEFEGKQAAQGLNVPFRPATPQAVASR